MRFLRHDSGVPSEKNVAPDDVSTQGPDAPLAHRRPGYSSSGCTPAEPDSAPPGNNHFILAPGQVQRTGARREVTRSRFKRIHVKIESGTQVASRGPTWRIATPLV